MATPFTISNAEVNAILNEVQKELEPIMKAAKEEAEKLAKGEGSAGPEASAPGSEGSASPAAEGSAGGNSAGGPPAAAGPDAGGPPAGAPPVDPAAGAAPAAPAADPAAGGQAGPVDPAQLEALYEQLSPEELEAHFVAIQSAVQKIQGGGAAPAAPDAGGVPPGAAAAPAAPMAPAPAGPAGGPPPGAGLPPTMKSEGRMIPSNATNGGKELSKSEKETFQTELRKAQDDNKTLNGQVVQLIKAVELLSKPLRKAVTGLEYIPRSDATPEAKSLTKAEITQKLLAKTKDATLAKSERQVINDFYDGRVGLDKIQHLLK